MITKNSDRIEVKIDAIATAMVRRIRDNHIQNAYSDAKVDMQELVESVKS